MWAWGDNSRGQLGIGNNVDSPIPVLVNGLNNVVAISCGGFHSMALKSDGTVWTWGWNLFGQLGHSDYVDVNSPVQVPSLTGIAGISAGWNHSLVLKSMGAVMAFGDNGNGQLGIGNLNSNTCLPTTIVGFGNVAAVEAGGYHSLALKNNGSVYAWGANSFGQLGDGTNSDANSPVNLDVLVDIIAVSGAGLHSFAIKSDSTLLAWGTNLNGELGIGTNLSSNVPLLVSTISPVVSVSAGFSHSQALDANGNFFNWGTNSLGQLGTGQNIDSNIPVTPINLCELSNFIAESELESSLHIFPNPSSGIFFIDESFRNESTMVSIFDLYGTLVYTGSADKLIDISHLLGGVYVCQLMSTRLHSVKLVKY